MKRRALPHLRLIAAFLESLSDPRREVPVTAESAVRTLEVLDVRNGQSLRQFPRATATYAAPSVGRGLILWTDALGHATALTVPGYRR